MLFTDDLRERATSLGLELQKVKEQSGRANLLMGTERNEINT